MSEAKPKPLIVGPRHGDSPEVSKNWIWKAGVGWIWNEPKGEETLAEKLKTKLSHANKPTEAIIQDATNANLAVASRLRRDVEVDWLSKVAPKLSSERSNPEQYRDNLMEYQQSIEHAVRALARTLMWMKRKQPK